jgi:hypothetical protein
MATANVSPNATGDQTVNSVDRLSALDDLLAKARELAELIGVDDPDPDTTQQLAREIRDTLERLAA